MNTDLNILLNNMQKEWEVLNNQYTEIGKQKHDLYEKINDLKKQISRMKKDEMSLSLYGEYNHDDFMLAVLRFINTKCTRFHNVLFSEEEIQEVVNLYSDNTNAREAAVLINVYNDKKTVSEASRCLGVKRHVVDSSLRSVLYKINKYLCKIASDKKNMEG